MSTSDESAGDVAGRRLRRRRVQEIWLLLGVSLGQSAVYAVISLVAKLTAGPPLAQQTATLNASVSPRAWLDLTYQVADIGFTLVLAALALWLLGADPGRRRAGTTHPDGLVEPTTDQTRLESTRTQPAAAQPTQTEPAGSQPTGLKPTAAQPTWTQPTGTGPTDVSPPQIPTPSGSEMIGFTLRRPGRDALSGLALAIVIGVPGLAFYWLGHRMGITATIVAAALNPTWWTIPVLILQAVKNAVLEEVIVVGYLCTRLRGLGWQVPAWVAVSAVLRGSYHLYQGYGPFVGNAVMGVVFALWFRRTGRVMPLVVAHTILDIVSFVGYEFLGGWLHGIGLA